MAWLVGGLAAVAWALFTLIGGFTGNVTPAVYSVTPTVANVLAGSCVTSVVGDDIDVQWAGVVGLDQCVIDVQWAAGLNDSPLVLQGFVSPAGLTASLDGCGTTFAPGQQGAAAITLTLTADDPFTGATFDPATDGAMFVRQVDYDPLLCPS